MDRHKLPYLSQISRGQAQINLSEARFFLVPESQSIYCIVGRFMAVQSHIPGVPEGNN
jgi:hypothetical protein